MGFVELRTETASISHGRHGTFIRPRELGSRERQHFASMRVLCMPHGNGSVGSGINEEEDDLLDQR